jgi:hypothetical protein
MSAEIMNIHIPLPERAETRRKIIADVLAAYEMDADELFNNKTRNHAVSDARRDAVRMLRDAGFTRSQITRIMKIHHSSVDFYLSPNYRIKRKQEMRVLHAHSMLPSHAKDAVAKIAERDGVKLFAMLAQWIEERAQIEIAQRREVAA